MGSSTALHLARRGYTDIRVLDVYESPSANSAGNDLNKVSRRRRAASATATAAAAAIPVRAWHVLLGRSVPIHRHVDAIENGSRWLTQTDRRDGQHRRMGRAQHRGMGHVDE